MNKLRPYRGKRQRDKDSFLEWLQWWKVEKVARRPTDWTNSDVPRLSGILVFTQKGGSKRIYGYTFDREFWALGDRVCRLHISGVTGTGRPYFGIRPKLVSPIPWKLEPTSKGGMHLFCPGRLIVVGPTTTNELEIFAVKPGSNHFHR